MARIEGTKPKAVRRRVLPKWNADPFGVAVILAPVAILAPNDWLRAIAVVVVIAAAWFEGFLQGRSDYAREVLRDIRRDDGAA